MQLNFNILDWIIIIIYFILVIRLSYRKNEFDVGEEEFLLSGRRMTLPAFVATLVSTFYGGILGVGEYSYQFGISEWVLFGFPFYVFSFLFAWLLAKKIRNNPALTIPDAVRVEYGDKAANISAVGVFILVSPAPYILMLGLLFQYMFGGHGSVLLYAVLVSIFSVGYVSTGGFEAVVRTDVMQMILMYGGFIFLLIFSIHDYGGLAKMWHDVPPVFRDLKGGHSIQYVLVWFFIALWTFVDPSFHQRAAAAKTPETAYNGILISIIFWMVFDFLTVTCGMYGFLILGHIDKPAMVYPYLADKLLPMGFRGLFYVALLATIMSTLDSYLFIAGLTLGRDLFVNLFPKIKKVLLTRISVIIAAGLSIALIYFYPSVISLWYVIGSVMIPGLLIPVLGIYLPVFRLKKRYIIPLMVLSTGISFAWLVLGTIHSKGTYSESYLGIEPFYPGTFLSVFLWVIGRDRQAKKTVFKQLEEINDP